MMSFEFITLSSVLLVDKTKFDCKTHSSGHNLYLSLQILSSPSAMGDNSKTKPSTQTYQFIKPQSLLNKSQANKLELEKCI